MSTQSHLMSSHAWPRVIVIAGAKPVLGLSRSEQKRTRSAIAKQLRQEGIYLMHWGPLWFAVADHPCSARDVEKQLLKCTLLSHRIRHLSLYGGYSFNDIFALNSQSSPRSAESVMLKFGLQLAFNVMREGDPSWPIYDDLMHALGSMRDLPAGSSRLSVSFGD